MGTSRFPLQWLLLGKCSGQLPALSGFPGRWCCLGVPFACYSSCDRTLSRSVLSFPRKSTRTSSSGSTAPTVAFSPLYPLIQPNCSSGWLTFFCTPPGSSVPQANAPLKPAGLSDHIPCRPFTSFPLPHTTQEAQSVLQPEALLPLVRALGSCPSPPSHRVPAVKGQSLTKLAHSINQQLLGPHAPQASCQRLTKTHTVESGNHLSPGLMSWRSSRGKRKGKLSSAHLNIRMRRQNLFQCQ